MTQIHREPWAVVATGMMVPGLKSIARKLGPCFPDDLHDLDSEILEAFLRALDRADPSRPEVSKWLYHAAVRRG